MQIKDIQEKHRTIGKLVARKEIKSALEILNELITEARNPQYREKYEYFHDTYENMLKYTIEGARDPEREKIYNHLRTSILELADQLKEELLQAVSGWKTFAFKASLRKEQKLTGNDPPEKPEDLFFGQELMHMLEDDYQHPEPGSGKAVTHREMVDRLFDFIWLSDTYGFVENQIVVQGLNSNAFAWQEKCLFVSALTLSLLRYFDEDKFHRLFDIFEQSESRVSERALTGLIIGLYRYDNRLAMYPEIANRVKLLKDHKKIQRHIEAILLQLIRSRETEKISRKLREEIIPEMARLGPKLEEKLDLKNLVPEEISEEKNPDWKNIFEDSEDLYSKVEEFSKLQLEGADVFMTAFANLKHFDFFRKMNHWFLPFYTDNEQIDEALKTEDVSFDRSVLAEGLQVSPFLCNSDKYSFVMNIKFMPGSQKKVMLELFNSELEAMNEMAGQDGLLDSFKRSRIIYTQYIQDLYRFLKLYPHRNEFQDIFSEDLDIYNTFFFRTLINDPVILRNIAEYFFEKNNFAEAIRIYRHLEKTEEKSFETTEKIAFSYQKLGNYQKALDYYLKAELYDKNRPWILKKIAYCHRKMNNPEKALEYYQEAEKTDPDNLHTQAMIGYCYLSMEDYQTALEHYFKVEYMDPKNTKVLRPIAWCYFVEGNMKDSEKYYRRIFEKEPGFYDHINYGHVKWCLGERKPAIELYAKGIQNSNMTLDNFLESFEEDRKIMEQHGIDPDEVPIMLDYLRYMIGK